MSGNKTDVERTAGSREVDERVSGRTPIASRDVDALHFRALVAGSTYAIVTLDLEQRLLSWNAGAERLFQASAEEMIGKNLAVLMTEVDASLASFAHRIAQGETVELEARLRDLEGRLLDTLVTATPVRDESGAVVGSAAIIRDVTQAKQLERRLREASQIDAIGRIAAGIAHDINNVLAIVQSYTEFVGSGPLTAEQAEDLGLAQDAAKRGAVLTNQLLNLGRRREVLPEVVDLNQLVQRLEELLRRSLGHGVHLGLQLALVPLRVRVPPGHIDQILMNLVLNARDAMSGGGTVQLALRSTVVNPGDRLSDRLRPGGYALLSVTDSGCGMSSETLSRIFEPLYTTKPAGRGSGLGLSVVQEAVRELGGGIEVESTPGEGSIFRVFIPLMDERDEPAAAGEQGLTGGPPRILVIEDDPALRMALRRMLKSSGFDLLLAADEAEAADLARRHPGKIDVLLMDLLLPGAAAAELVKRLRQLRPQLRVVVVSGQRLPRVEQFEDALFVPKPFAATDLLSALERAVKAAPPAPSLPPRKPRVLVVDDDDELSASLVRLLEEEQLDATAAKSGLHALQLLRDKEFDVVVTDQFMPGMEGVRLLELVAAQHPRIQRVLFTAHAAPDVVLDAINRGRVAKVLLKTMHPIQIRDEIQAVANESLPSRSLRRY